MKTFDVQGIDLRVPRDRAFAYIADPARLPAWTSAFASVAGGRAVLRTPSGEVEIALGVDASPDRGTVDWHMTFPDGSVASAYSRLVRTGREACVFSFVLTPPPVPLEQLEGALEAQSRTLAEELRKLKGLLERGG
jgi:hypothetical protein